MAALKRPWEGGVTCRPTPPGIPGGPGGPGLPWERKIKLDRERTAGACKHTARDIPILTLLELPLSLPDFSEFVSML